MNLELGVREALDTVHFLGQDGKEHAIILRDGAVIFRADGTSKKVSLTDAHAQKGDILIHNHPNSLNSLSNVDIAQMFFAGYGAVYAISADKSVYKASPAWSIKNPSEHAARIFLEAWEGIWLETLPTLIYDVKPVVRNSKIQLEEAHWVNVELAEHGLIKYEFELGDATALILSEIACHSTNNCKDKS